MIVKRIFANFEEALERSPDRELVNILMHE
jgi:hypothetical protein